MREVEPLDIKGSARRKLIRGSFAVPAVLALHSGASIAAASVNSCLVRQNRQQVTQPASGSDDVWFRYRLWGYVNSRSGVVAEHAGLWIRGSDLSVYGVGGNSVWLSGSAYQQFDVRSNALGQKKYSQPEGPNGFEWSKVNHWVSLRVDAQGNLTGAGSGWEGSAVADSCWNSFAMGARM